ncbi:MAG: MFS transporter [Deltaproteobacteria bacterium]|nr:MFS transporter [Deltaproteobacteria bacterium]
MCRHNYPPAYQSWLILCLGIAFYFSGFFHRMVTAVMADQLMTDFNIGAASLGNFSSFYYYSYVAVQIPTGILADYWGPRKLLATGALLSAVGAFIFSAAPSIMAANMGRLIIGASMGVAWVSILKLSTRWFKSNQFAVVTGLALCLGILGALTAGVPLRILMNLFGWRAVIAGAGIITLILSLAIWMLVRDDPAQKGYDSYAADLEPTPDRPGAHLLRDISSLLRYRNTWILTIVPASLMGPVLTFAGLWGIPYLTTHYDLSPVKSASLISTLLIACALGAPILGALSERMGRRKPIYTFSLCISLMGWIPIVYIHNMPLWLLVLLFAIVGFAAGAIVIGMVFVKESVPLALAGTISGISNMGMEMGPLLLQPAIGLILDLKWGGLVENGIRIYGLNAYRMAFGAIIGLSILGALLILFSKETFCRQWQA